MTRGGFIDCHEVLDARADRVIDALPDDRCVRASPHHDHSEASLVFCAFQDARLHAVADESSDRHRDRLGAILMVTRFARLGRKLVIASAAAAGDLRAFAARQSAALSAGVALSGVGRRARRARWHRRARRVDRTRSFSRTWHGGGQRRGRSHHCGGGACASLSERAHRVLRRQRESGFERRQGSRFRRRDLRKPRHPKNRG